MDEETKETKVDESLGKDILDSVAMEEPGDYDDSEQEDMMGEEGADEESSKKSLMPDLSGGYEIKGGIIVAALSALITIIASIIGWVGFGTFIINFLIFTVIGFVLGFGIVYLLKLLTPEVFNMTGQTGDQDSIGENIDLTAGEEEEYSAPEYSHLEPNIPTDEEIHSSMNKPKDPKKFMKKGDVTIPKDPKVIAEAIRTVMSKDQT